LKKDVRKRKEKKTKENKRKQSEASLRSYREIESDKGLVLIRTVGTLATPSATTAQKTATGESASMAGAKRNPMG
jgi:hypothetical protein